MKIVKDYLIFFSEKIASKNEKKNLFFFSYTYGTQVKLQLKEFEMAEKFLGSARHTSLLEADAVLLGHVTQKEVLQEELQENILF